MTYRSAVALGSNRGDRLETLREAVSGLATLGEVAAVSSLYETEPVGGPEQPSYLNAVVVLDSEFEPIQLLDELNRIEAAAGRIRTERWGPRTLDLDLITVVQAEGEWQTVETDRLVLPHPRAHLRRFVVEPLAEVWPRAPIGAGETAQHLLAGLGDQVTEVLGKGWLDRNWRNARYLVGLQVLIFIVYAVVVGFTGRIPDRVEPSIVAGSALAALGAGLAVWGATTLGPALSPYPEPRRGTSLVVAGPYRFVRHPIYSGLVLSSIGLAMLAASLWAGLLAVAIGGFFFLKARYEESRLRLAVPGYVAYQRRVRGRFFPLGGAST